MVGYFLHWVCTLYIDDHGSWSSFRVDTEKIRWTVIRYRQARDVSFRLILQTVSLTITDFLSS